MDLYKTKQEVHLKMPTAAHCPQCMRPLEHKKAPQSLFNQVIATWDDIRRNMSFYIGAGSSKNTQNITIDFNHRREIQFSAPDISVALSPLHMAIYALHLKHEEGINLSDHPSFRRDFEKLYTMLSGRGDEDIFFRIFNNNQVGEHNRNLPSLEISYLRRRFYQNVSKINKIIKMAINNDKQASTYLIVNDNQRSKILVPRSNITWLTMPFIKGHCGEIVKEAPWQRPSWNANE